MVGGDQPPSRLPARPDRDCAIAMASERPGVPVNDEPNISDAARPLTYVLDTSVPCNPVSVTVYPPDPVASAT